MSDSMAGVVMGSALDRQVMDAMGAAEVNTNPCDVPYVTGRMVPPAYSTDPALVGAMLDWCVSRRDARICMRGNYLAWCFSLPGHAVYVEGETLSMALCMLVLHISRCCAGKGHVLPTLDATTPSVSDSRESQ